MVCTLEFAENWLKLNLSAERFEHSLGTADSAEKLAIQFKLDSKKAFFTGLIHDCAKCLPKADIDEILTKIKLESSEINSPKTHHAPAGAYVAQTVFGVEDREILSAIRWHTIGKINMTDFEKIIFIADKIEERTRPVEWTTPVKEALLHENGLDRAMLICYKNTLKSLVDRNLIIASQTIDVYNDLLCNMKNLDE